ncbi:MAG: hypothetical protein QUS11_07020 [Candidatus Fermentibacter sp.]|nr:hypothetical protein [Candidatus Fermentibacter sp.]
MMHSGRFFVLLALAFLTAIPAQAAEMPATMSGVLHSLAAVPAVDLAQSSQPICMPFANVIDQNQPSATVYMAAFAQYDLAQSFQQTNANISGAGIMLYSGSGTSDNVTIQLWTDLPNAGGTMLTQASATGTAGEWVDVFWTAVPVTPATTYFLVFTGNTTLGINGDTANPYPYGCVYANTGFMQFAGFDYTFRTYYDDALSLERTTWAEVKSAF